jgi:hypothetical protein
MTQCTASEANAIPQTLSRKSLGSMTQLSKLCHFGLGPVRVRTERSGSCPACAILGASGPCAYGEVQRGARRSRVGVRSVCVRRGPLGRIEREDRIGPVRVRTERSNETHYASGPCVYGEVSSVGDALGSARVCTERSRVFRTALSRSGPCAYGEVFPIYQLASGPCVYGEVWSKPPGSSWSAVRPVCVRRALSTGVWVLLFSVFPLANQPD